MRTYRLILPAALALGLGACATQDWRTITDVKEIASTRTAVNKPSPDFSKILILRLERNGQRTDVSSIAPATISAAKNGPPGARTVFAFTSDRSKLMLFAQNVPELKGFYQEIPVSELQPGKRFSFPVVQLDGTVQEEVFTVSQLITPEL